MGKRVANLSLPPYLLKAPVCIGLRAQGHLPTIEKMLERGAAWDEIGKEIGWDGDTAKEWYEYEQGSKQKQLGKHNMEMKEEDKLPVVTQEPLLNVDGTPDRDYPLRILRAHRENCNCKWVSDKSNPLLDVMNDDCDRRAKILDHAICILEEEEQKEDYHINYPNTKAGGQKH